MDTILVPQEDVSLYLNNAHLQPNGMDKNAQYQVHALTAHISVQMHASHTINVQMVILGTHSSSVAYVLQTQSIQETDAWSAPINKNGALQLVALAQMEHLIVELHVSHQMQASAALL